MKKILVVYGTRPEAVKMCPLVLELKKCADFDTRVCVTGQHREMLKMVNEAFSVTPDFDLDIMQKSQTITEITVRILEKLAPVLTEFAPDLVLVHGDTTTSFAAALAAFYHQIPVGHVEAGLRTGDKYSPFPEEQNRTLTGHIAALHFCPTQANRQNLHTENITSGITLTGNTVIDALHTTVREDYAFTTPGLSGFIGGNRLILLTAHRRENIGEPMERIFAAVRTLADTFEDVRIVYPVHPNPKVLEPANRLLSGHPRILLTEPMDVLEMHNAMARAYLVLTDSGGLQEEAPALGKPVLVLREETERPEAVDAGTVLLAGTKSEQILSIAKTLLSDKTAYDAMAKAVNPYGDGHACERISAAISAYFDRR